MQTDKKVMVSSVVPGTSGTGETGLIIRPVAVPPEPLKLFAFMAAEPYSFLLESGLVLNTLGRYSFCGWEPFMVVVSRGYEIAISQGGSWQRKTEHPLFELRRLLAPYRHPGVSSPFPFCGGGVGFFSYDLGRVLERIPSLARDDLLLPDMVMAFYDTVVAIDHVTGMVAVVGNEAAGSTAAKVERWACLLERMAEGQYEISPDKESFESQRVTLQTHFNLESYCAMVEKAREYIAAGDIFQVNLAQRFAVPQVISPWNLYRRLRRVNPAPCAAYLNYPEQGLQIVSASPERFLMVRNRQVETRPIKGTRPRGRTPEEDRRLRNELWCSEKDRAELVMIVDLERNDLGKVCRVGSVHVPELYRLETYATVYHLVATVCGELRPECDLIDLIRASFPGGSITGAPKIRAMEIIDELEPVRRGPYTGSIGYIGFNDWMDLNIVIRTFVCTGGHIYWHAGGGITYDSQPAAEYLETLDKARALFRALELGEVTKVVGAAT